MDDRALVEATLDGDRDAFARLVRKYQASLIASACHLVQQRDDAEDMAQETFVEAYRRLGALRERDKFSGWLFVILRNKCLRYLKNRRLNLSLEEYGDMPAAPPSVDEEALTDALRRLPLLDREVLAARYLQGLDYDEVARALGIGIEAAQKRCSRARERLRHLMQEADEERTRLLMRHAMGIMLTGSLGDVFTDRVLRKVNALRIVTPSPDAVHGHTGQPIWWRLAAQLVRQKIIAGSIALVLAAGAISFTVLKTGSSTKGGVAGPAAVRPEPATAEHAPAQNTRTASPTLVSGGSSQPPSSVSAGAGAILATVHVGSGPSAVAVNPTTDRVYITNREENTVSVLAGNAESVLATVHVGGGPVAVAVNGAINLIYVCNSIDNTVSVIDGKAHAVLATVPVGKIPWGVAVNPVTNRIYVCNMWSNSVSVIDGRTNTVIKAIDVGKLPQGVAVNPQTNRVYVCNSRDNTVSILDGHTDACLATVKVGASPDAVAVNPVTNRFYVVNYADGTMNALDGEANTILATVRVGTHPETVSVNPKSNHIYMSINGEYFVSVLDGRANQVIAIVPAGVWPTAVAVNPITNRAYECHFLRDTASVIQGY